MRTHQETERAHPATATGPAAGRLLVAAVAAVTLSACSATEPITPLPGPSASGSGSAAPTSGPAGAPPSSVDPCSYLPADQAQKLGVQPGVPGVSSPGSTGCDYGGDPGFTVAYFSARPYEDKLTDVTPVTINEGAHPAVQGHFDDSGSGCEVSMELSETSSVAIIAESPGLSQDQDCRVAQLAARAVEPNLPRI